MTSSHGGQRTIQAASACANRNADRGDGHLCDQVEGFIRKADSAAGSSAASSTTLACPTAASIFPTAIRRRLASAMPTLWSRSRRTIGQRTSYVHDLRLNLARAFPGRYVLFPAGRHREPDSELRIAGSDRCSGRGQQSGGQPAVCGQTVGSR